MLNVDFTIYKKLFTTTQNANAHETYTNNTQCCSNSFTVVVILEKQH